MTTGRWEIPKEWAWVQAREIASIIGGGTPKTSDEANFSEQGIPWVTPADLSNYEASYIKRGRRDISEKGFQTSSARLLPKGTVLFTSRAPIGYCVIAANKVTTNQGFKSLVLDDEIDPKYIRYYLLSSRDYAESLASGSTFKELSGRKTEEIKIPLPPLNEQRRIVTKIEELSVHSKRAREALEDIPKLIDQFRQSVLAAAFRGDLTAEWRKQNPDVEPASELLGRIRDEHLEEYQAAIKKAEQDGLNKPKKPSILSCGEQENSYSCLSNSPSGWIFIRLDLALPPGCIFDGPFGSHLKTSDYVDSGVRVVRLENISSLNFIDEKKSFITLQKYELLKKHSVYTGDLIFSSFVADGVRVCILPVLEEPAIAKADCFCLRPDLKLVDKEYLAFLLSSPQFFIQLQKLAHGATRLRVNTKQLRNTLIPLCSLREQRKIVQIVKRTFLIIDKIEKGYRDDVSNFNQLDQSILAKAFRGELVPQDPNDEPASVLLEHIRAEREKLGKGKKATRRGKKA